MNLFDLSGKVAVVTGGNDGLGFGIAQGMALAGAGIVVAGRRAEKNVAAAQMLAALGVNTAAVEVDVSKEPSCRSLLETTLQRFGRIDILINNAGIAIRKQPEAYTLGEWNKVIDTNLTGAFLCSQAAYPHMKRNGGGKIVNIGSMHLDLWRLFRRRLWSEQGRPGSDDQGAGVCMGQGQHPGQCHPAGLDRYAIDRIGAQGGRWSP